MSQLHHKKEIDSGTIAKGYFLFALLLCVFMMGTSFTSIDSVQSANVTIAPHTTQDYFVLEEIPGNFNLSKAEFGMEVINLQNDKYQFMMKESNLEKWSYEDVGIQNPMKETNVTLKSTNKNFNFNSNKIQFSDSDNDTPENFDIILN